MTIFEKNMTTLQKQAPNFKMLRDSLGEEVFLVEETRLGYKTLKCIQNEKTFFVHSKFNPVKEGEEFANAYASHIKLSRIVVLFGLGMGYAADAIRKIKDSETILIILEPSWEAFQLAMSNIDLTNILSDGTVLLSVGQEIDVMTHIIKQTFDLETYEKAVLAFNPAYKNIFPNLCVELSKIIFDVIKDFRINKETVYKKSLAWSFITLINTKHILKSKSITIFHHKFKDKPAIIVSAGPSLSKNVDFLHQAKGKFVIICVYTALQALLRKNIMPDFVVVLDAGQGKRESEEQKKQLFDIPLIYLSTANHDLLNRFIGEKIYCRTTFDDILENIIPNEKRKSIKEIFTAGTVSISAMDFAVYAGANPIVLIGQDLAFIDNKTHADGTIYGDNKKAQERTIQRTKKYYVTGIDGSVLETNAQFSTYLNAFQEYIGFFEKIKFIDATEGGALIKGTEVKTLAETIKEYGHHDTNISDLIRQVLSEENLFTDEDYSNAMQQIRVQIELASRLKRNAEKGLSLTKKAENMFQYEQVKEKETRKIIREFDILDHKMNRIIDQTKLFVSIYSVIQIKMLSHLPEHEKTEQMYFIKHSQLLYEYIVTMCDKILEGLRRLQQSLT